MRQAFDSFTEHLKRFSKQITWLPKEEFEIFTEEKFQRQELENVRTMSVDPKIWHVLQIWMIQQLIKFVSLK